MLQEHAQSSTLNIGRINEEINILSIENQYVTFQIGEEEYGIDIMLVQEIVRYKKPTRVFNANPMIKGVINFRGKVIPVINMHRKFNLPAGEYDEFTVVIIIEVEQKTIGMIVDHVSDIMSFDAAEMQLVDREFASDIKTEHLKGMGKSGERIILLLDPYKVLSLSELHDIQELAGQEEALQAVNNNN